MSRGLSLGKNIQITFTGLRSNIRRCELNQIPRSQSDNIRIDQIKENNRASVFKVLTNEWQAVRVIAALVPMDRHSAAIALQNLHESHQVEWKPFPKSSYRLKQ